MMPTYDIINNRTEHLSSRFVGGYLFLSKLMGVPEIAA